MDKRWFSRKFILAVVAALVAFGNAMFNWGLSTEELISILGPLLAFIGVEGAADVMERTKGSTNVDVETAKNIEVGKKG